ncbi:MAG: hypothetical protein HPY69_09100 [Armatimonadetes bacterium]|nr:hypothetical protein [Armatimonadota bacterium]
MGRRGTPHAVAMVVALGTLAGLGEAQDVWKPMPMYVETALTEAQPPRALLDQTVSVTLTGTVAEVVRALAEAAGRDWVVSAPSDDFGPAKEFRAENVPLWQAMDRLLETFEYDWGVHARVLVAWPATQPARERPETPGPEEEVWVDNAPREALLMDKPTALQDLLDPLSRCFDKYGDYVGEYACVAPELRSWRVLGQISKLDRMNGRSVPLAVGAVIDGAGGVMTLEYGTLRRLDDAFAARAGRPVGTESDTAEKSMARRTRFRNALLGLLGAAQWVALRNGVEVQIAFRELPLETAVLFLDIMDEMARSRGEPWPVDWSQPQRLHITVRAGQTACGQPDGTVLMLPTLQIGCNIPLRGGRFARF